MKRKLLPIAFFTSMNLFSQVGVGTNNPHNSAILDLTSTNKGFLPTRVNLLNSRDVRTIPSPAQGLIVYHLGNVNLISGYYYFNGTEWTKLIDFQVDSKVQGSSITKQRLTPASPNVVLTTASGNFSFRYNGTRSGDYWQIRNNDVKEHLISTFVVENWTPDGQSASTGVNYLDSHIWTNISGGTNVGTVNELNVFRIYDLFEGTIIKFEGILINSTGTESSMIVEEF